MFIVLGDSARSSSFNSANLDESGGCLRLAASGVTTTDSGGDSIRSLCSPGKEFMGQPGINRLIDFYNIIRNLALLQNNGPKSSFL